MSDLTSEDILATIQGDLGAFSRLQKHAHSALLENSSRLDTLTVTAAAMKRVLVALRDGQASPTLVHQWGFFVRHGYIGDWIEDTGRAKLSAQDRKLPQPLEIEYEFEDAIIEVIARLDEIGDSVDGEITKDEIALMLPTLDELGGD